MAEKKVRDRVAIMGQVFRIEARLLRSDESNHKGENYVVSFEGEITVEAESKELAEDQAYDRLSHLGRVTVMAFKE